MNTVIAEHRQVPPKATKWAWFVTHFRVSYLFLIGIVVMGTLAFFQLPRESDPEVKIPIDIVTTVYPGASPLDVEQLVTDKIEAKLGSLENLDSINSYSREGLSTIVVQFTMDVDVTEGFRDLQDRVNEAKAELPNEIDSDPMVTKVSADATPVLTFSLSGPLDPAEISDLADKLKDDLEALPGVQEVGISGQSIRQMNVRLEKSKMDLFGISVSQVTGVISANSLNFPLGSIEVDELNYSIRLENEVKTAEELAKLPIFAQGETVVTLADLGEVTEGFEERSSISRLSVNGGEAESAVSISVKKAPGANILKTVDNCFKKIDEFEVPNGVKMEVSMDLSEFVREDFSRLGNSGWQAMLIIFLVLLPFLGWRMSIFASISVPVAFLLTFIVMGLVGETLNSLSLFSLVLSLGIMVDVAIIIVEGFYENLRKGWSLKDCAIGSIETYKWPVLAGLLTTIAVFIPMTMMSGILGEYMSHIPITVIATLSSAFIVAIAIIPVLMVRWVNPKKSLDNAKSEDLQHKLIGKRYDRFIRWLFASTKRRRTFVGVFWGLFFIAVALPASGLLKMELFPRFDGDWFYVNLEMPAGTVLERTDEEIKKVEEFLRKEERIENFSTVVGSSASFDNFGGGGSASENLAAITVNLPKAKDRSWTAFELIDELRPKLKALVPNQKLSVDELKAGPPSGAALEVRVLGDDLDEIEIIVREIEEFLKGVTGLAEVDTSIDQGVGEFVVKIDPQKAAIAGVNVRTVAAEMRGAIFGMDVQEVNRDGTDTDINVAFDKIDVNDMEKMKDLLFVNSRGEMVSINQFAEVEWVAAVRTIVHQDKERMHTVTADNPGIDLQTATALVEEFVDNDLEMPDGMMVETGGQNEDTTESMTSLLRAMVFGILLIILILVIQFNSFKQPLIILFTLPLAMIGVFFGLTLLGLRLSLPAMIGIVALAGIVVNDAIVLIDRVNVNRKHGMNITDSIIEAGHARIIPIVLTTLTTTGGMLPLALSDPMWMGLSFSVICGLIFATVLTLLVIPAMYKGLEKEGEID